MELRPRPLEKLASHREVVVPRDAEKAEDDEITARGGGGNEGVAAAPVSVPPTAEERQQLEAATTAGNALEGSAFPSLLNTDTRAVEMFMHNVVTTLNLLTIRTRFRYRLHQYMEGRTNCYDRCLSIVLTLFYVIASAGAVNFLGTWTELPGLRMVMGGAVLLVTFLTWCQRYAKFSTRSKLYGLVAKRWDSLATACTYKCMLVSHADPATVNIEELQDILELAFSDFNAVRDVAPPIPSSVMQRHAKLWRKRYHSIQQHLEQSGGGSDERQNGTVLSQRSQAVSGMLRVSRSGAVPDAVLDSILMPEANEGFQEMTPWTALRKTRAVEDGELPAEGREDGPGDGEVHSVRTASGDGVRQASPEPERLPVPERASHNGVAGPSLRQAPVARALPVEGKQVHAKVAPVLSKVVRRLSQVRAVSRAAAAREPCSPPGQRQSDVGPAKSRSAASTPSPPVSASTPSPGRAAVLQAVLSPRTRQLSDGSARSSMSRDAARSVLPSQQRAPVAVDAPTMTGRTATHSVTSTMSSLRGSTASYLLSEPRPLLARAIQQRGSGRFSRGSPSRSMDISSRLMMETLDQKLQRG